MAKAEASPVVIDSTWLRDKLFPRSTYETMQNDYSEEKLYWK